MAMHEELPIDVAELADVLYKLKCALIKDPNMSFQISYCAMRLKANIAEKKLKHFLKQLGKVFSLKDELQPQLLLMAFIKETLSSDEMAIFRNLVTNSTRLVLTPSRKNAILLELG